ncbi:MAG: hypothetical protein HWD84_11435 [Flavobacteriaceae bacterium]|nr:hypothetical protein [Flavobacteriaceae bacterium]NVK84162.1 hypothetical protein [Cytophagia bacterium]
MQQTLLIRLANFVRPLVVGTIKSFRTTLLASGLFLALSMQVNAQDEWKRVTTIDGVEISYQKASCDGSEVLLIKAVNKSDASVSIDLTYTFQSKVDNSIMGTGELGEIEIAPQSELSGSCEDGLHININNHFSMYSEEEFSLTITKTE